MMAVGHQGASAHPHLEHVVLRPWTSCGGNEQPGYRRLRAFVGPRSQGGRVQYQRCPPLLADAGRAGVAAHAAPLTVPSSQILSDLQERRARRRQRFKQQLHPLEQPSPDSPDHVKEETSPEPPSDPSSAASSGLQSAALSVVSPPASAALEGPAVSEAPGTRSTARVHFGLRFRTEWGQRLRIVGSQKGLGNWRLEDGHNMKWSTGDNWVAEVTLPTGSIYEYKFVVVEHATGQAIAWQSGNNSVLALRPEDKAVDVFDNWGGEPGAQLVADGSKPMTREQRLLSWAVEMETSMVGQRQELRRARMELVAAHEDARKAREESKRMYARLAESEAARIAVATNLRAAETANKVLTAQLNEVNLSFKTALETAAELLDSITSRPRRRKSVGQAAEPAKEVSPAQPGNVAQAASPAVPTPASQGTLPKPEHLGSPISKKGSGRP